MANMRTHMDEINSLASVAAREQSLVQGASRLDDELSSVVERWLDHILLIFMTVLTNVKVIDLPILRENGDL